MNTIHDLFSNYGWKEVKQCDKVKQCNNTLSKHIYIKNNGFNEFIVEPTNENTYIISIPLLNSVYLYKQTINNIQDTIRYIQIHLENFNTNT